LENLSKGKKFFWVPPGRKPKQPLPIKRKLRIFEKGLVPFLEGKDKRNFGF